MCKNARFVKIRTKRLFPIVINVDDIYQIDIFHTSIYVNLRRNGYLIKTKVFKLDREKDSEDIKRLEEMIGVDLLDSSFLI